MSYLLQAETNTQRQTERAIEILIKQTTFDCIRQTDRQTDRQTQQH